MFSKQMVQQVQLEMQEALLQVQQLYVQVSEREEHYSACVCQLQQAADQLQHISNIKEQVACICT